MSSKNAIDNEGWTTIVKKPRQIISKPLKYTYKWIADVTKKDITLTPKEKKILANTELNIFCNCCQSHLISDVICRSFLSCGRCYCCVGDDPAFDLYEFHYESTFYKYNKDYHYTKDADFHENLN
jgi:hypothetical protein